MHPVHDEDHIKLDETIRRKKQANDLMLITLRCKLGHDVNLSRRRTQISWRGTWSCSVPRLPERTDSISADTTKLFVSETAGAGKKKTGVNAPLQYFVPLKTCCQK